MSAPPARRRRDGARFGFTAERIGREGGELLDTVN
jgi:hypothetical protein